MTKTVIVAVSQNDIQAYNNISSASAYLKIPYFKLYRALKKKDHTQVGEYTIHSLKVR